MTATAFLFENAVTFFEIFLHSLCQNRVFGRSNNRGRYFFASIGSVATNGVCYCPCRQNLHAKAFRFPLVGKIPEPCFWENPNPYHYEKQRSVAHMDNGNDNEGGRKREIILRLAVTEAERDFIFEKMEQLNTRNFGAYARKMLIDGYAITTDYSDLKAVCAEMQKIGVNINQIAKRVNGTSRIYEQDIEQMRGVLDEIWRLQRLSLLKAR
jgi:hypothetical protein